MKRRTSSARALVEVILGLLFCNAIHAADADPEISISATHEGNLRVSWIGDGALERAPSVNGPWVAVAGARSPYETVAPNAGYFRVRRNSPDSTEGYRIADRSPHAREWLRPREAIRSGVRDFFDFGYVHLASGMHVLDPQSGDLADADPTLRLQPDGAAAANGIQQRARFAPNVNDGSGAIGVETPDGDMLWLSPLALSYYDPVSGRSALIAATVDALGEIVAPTQILFRNAFDTLNADILVTTKTAGVTIGVILRESPKSPESLAGMPNETSFLQVIAEFFPPAAPTVFSKPALKVDSPTLRAQMAEPEFAADYLEFGNLSLPAGKAVFQRFDSPHEQAGASAIEIPVRQQWKIRDGRTFLIEAVDFLAIEPFLKALTDPAEPAASSLPSWDVRIENALAKIDALPNAAADGQIFPDRQPSETFSGPMAVSTAGRADRSGLSIEFAIVSTLRDFTFEERQTYLITRPLFLSGTTTIEEGTIIKRGRDPSCPDPAQIVVYGALNNQATRLQPVIITSADDDFVGEPIINSAAIPTEAVPGEALRLESIRGVEAYQLTHIKVRRAETAFVFRGGGPHRVRHAQLTDNGVAIDLRDADLVIQNALIARVDDAVFKTETASSAIQALHLTISDVTERLLAGAGSLAITNSALINIPNTASTRQGFNHTNSGPAGVFQTVGAGEFYLIPGSPLKDSGTSDYAPDIRDEIRRMTTSPPTLFCCVNITSDVTLTPDVPRDDDGFIDIGYHYPPIDFAVSRLVADNAAITVADRVQVATFGPIGIRLRGASRVAPEGGQVFRFQAAQEGAEWDGPPDPNHLEITYDFNLSGHLDSRFAGDGLNVIEMIQPEP